MPAKHTGQVAASPGNTEDLYNKWIASLWIKVGLCSLSWIPERKKYIKKKITHLSGLSERYQYKC